jgi:hypothetical protein
MVSLAESDTSSAPRVVQAPVRNPSAIAIAQARVVEFETTDITLCTRLFIDQIGDRSSIWVSQ